MCVAFMWRSAKNRLRLPRWCSILEENGAMDHTIVVVAVASDPAALQYIAPFAGTAMGEEIMENGAECSDRVRRPFQARLGVSPGFSSSPPPSGPRGVSGRRLLPPLPVARACCTPQATISEVVRSRRLPIIETQAADVSAYIPTNVISITDGQIYLEARAVLLQVFDRQ